MAEANPKNGLPYRYVGRGTRWGNPFRYLVWRKDYEVERTQAAYVEMLGSFDAAKWEWYLKPLVGHNLCCWCAMDAHWCHADLLIDLAWNFQQEQYGLVTP